MENLKDIFNSYKSEIISAKGLTIDIDGIECYGLYGGIKKISFQDSFIYKGLGESIFVDKNHDFSFYLKKDGLIDNKEKDILRGYKGYLWRSTKFTDVTSTSIGSGLLNTNSLIEISLTREFDIWSISWNLIRKFRELRSDRWFLPSIDELNLVYKARNNLNNLAFTSSALIIPYYWSSSEHSAGKVWSLFNDGVCRHAPKYNIGSHLRLCVRY